MRKLMERYFGKKLIFYHDSPDTLTNIEILLSFVEIFMMTGRDLHDDKSRFYYELSRFSR